MDTTHVIALHDN